MLPRSLKVLMVGNKESRTHLRFVYQEGVVLNELDYFPTVCEWLLASSESLIMHLCINVKPYWTLPSTGTDGWGNYQGI